MKKVAGRLRSFGPATYFGKTDTVLGNTPIDYYLMPEQSIWTMQEFFHWCREQPSVFYCPSQQSIIILNYMLD